MECDEFRIYIYRYNYIYKVYGVMWMGVSR